MRVPRVWKSGPFVTRAVRLKHTAVETRLSGHLQEVLIMRIKSTAALLLASLALSSASWADEAAEQAAVAKQLPSAKVSLQQGLTAAAAQGRPISAKFEVDEGHFQLSVYTTQGKNFSEVIVDHQTGRVGKVESIAGGEDLAEAKSQAAVMAQKAGSLIAPVDKAEKSTPGSRAVSVTPALKEGHTVAVVSLLKDGKYTSVSEPLE
jgi:hypothetical protein